MMSARTVAWVRPTSTKKTPDPARVRSHLELIYAAAIKAVDPQRLVASFLTTNDGDRRAFDQNDCVVIGAGKAAARMAAGCEAALGPEHVRGLVITADACGVPLRHIECFEAGHPTPDERGRAATARLCDYVATSSTPVIALISGGASALLVQPAAPVTLAEKIAVNQLLLRRGASIDEVNTVRKHLSLVKGGGVLRRCVARPLLTLILSDVVGDDPSVIGSGPTVADPTTFAEAWTVLRRYDLAETVSPSVRERLIDGTRGEVEETVKPGAAVEDGSAWFLVGSNRTALAAAAEQATKLGYHTVVLSEPLLGDTCASAREWLRRVQQVADSAGSPWCVLAGGETTVNVRGAGRGGRNQEFALALVEPLAGSALSVLSAGTDGIDGPTDAAGAFVDGRTLARARVAGLDAGIALERNDSYGFFAPLHDLFAPGPTGTNVTDIKITVGGLA